MNDSRMLDRCDARWIARTVAKAMWAKMTMMSVGDLRTMTEQEWGEKINLLDDAVDAVIEHVPDRERPAKPGSDGSIRIAGSYPTSRAFCDAYNKLEGMPRDAFSRCGKAGGRET